MKDYKSFGSHPRNCKASNYHLHPRDRRARADERPEKSGSRKDTKRWCLGVVGRSHRKRWTVKHGTHMSVEVCSACSKEFRWCWHGWHGSLKSSPCICGEQGARTK